MIKTIETSKAPKVVGPYSQAIIANKFIFCSGQIGIDPSTEQFAGDTIEEQTKQIIINLKEILNVAGSNLENIVQTTCYLSDMNDYVLFNKIYGSFFSLHKPARATVQVSALPKNAKVEISIIALIK